MPKEGNSWLHTVSCVLSQEQHRGRAPVQCRHGKNAPLPTLEVLSLRRTLRVSSTGALSESPKGGWHVLCYPGLVSPCRQGMGHEAGDLVKSHSSTPSNSDASPCLYPSRSDKLAPKPICHPRTQPLQLLSRENLAPESSVKGRGACKIELALTLSRSAIYCWVSEPIACFFLRHCRRNSETAQLL